MLGPLDGCEKNIANSADKSKYKWLSLKTAGEYCELNSEGRTRTLIMRKAAVCGDYLEEILDKGRCDILHKILYLKYK